MKRNHDLVSVSVLRVPWLLGYGQRLGKGKRRRNVVGGRMSLRSSPCLKVFCPGTVFVK